MINTEKIAGWWARQDSNQQPDRYERPALTIELQAPPRAAAFDSASNGAASVYKVTGDPAMPYSDSISNLGVIQRGSSELLARIESK